MWLVNASLRHPYTVWVGMILVCIIGLISYFKTPTDILPQLKVPVVVVFSSYRGMPAPDMEETVTAILERALTKCDLLDHIESRSLLGISIIQIFFRPEANPDSASSQVIALVNGEMQNLPPGMLPPTILNYDASSVPVGNLVVSSPSRDDKFLLDFADNRLRNDLAGIKGLASAPVFGGVFRQVQIYVHPRTLEALKMSPLEVARLVNNQSQVIPTGEIRIGDQDYYVRSNAMARDPTDFANIPIASDGRKIVRLGDVAEIVDGTRWRTNTVRVDGTRAVYLPLLRQVGASTVDVVDNVQATLPQLYQRGLIPEDVAVEVAFDQSQYVREALANLRHEGILGAVLASLVVLLFLGDLRTTYIVALSIPLSVLAAFAGLYFTGETLNIMTLGGLALVLGRVVDDSVVDVENTVRHLGMGKTPFQAALDSANEIAVPVLMATVTTVIVFLPLVFVSGMGKYLFTPLAISAALALFASYFVSRTVSPLFCSRLLRADLHGHGEHGQHGPRERFPLWLLLPGLVLAFLGLIAWLSVHFRLLHLDRFHPGVVRGVYLTCQALMTAGLAGAVVVLMALLYLVAPLFNRVFEAFTRGYEWVLRVCLNWRVVVLLVILACVVPSFFAYEWMAQELFPDVDSGEFTVHMRASGGPRVEETERMVGEIEKIIRGYQGDGRDLVREVLRGRLDKDAPRLEALRGAGMKQARSASEGVEDAGPLVDRIIEAADDPQALAQISREIEDHTYAIPGVVPPEDMDMILSNIGLSSRWSAIYTPNNGPHAAFLRVQLRSGFAGRTTPAQVYVDRVHERLKARFPSHGFFFETGGMLRRILNAGGIAPIEVQVFGRSDVDRREVTRVLDKRISQLAGVQTTSLPQGIDLPQLKVIVDRARAMQPGLTESDVIRNVITALMSSSQIAPNFWIDPKSGNPYLIGVQYPEYAVHNVQTLEEIPITGVGKSGKGGAVVRLEDVATIERSQGPVEIYRYQVSPVNQVYVNVWTNDLAGVAGEVDGILRQLPLDFALNRLPQDKRRLTEAPDFQQQVAAYLSHKDPDSPEARAQGESLRKTYGVDPEKLRLPPDIRVSLRGEVEAMRSSFNEIGYTLVLAVLLVYLVMVAQFASWIDPLVMIVSAPLGLLGVALTLYLTNTSLNIQSLMGVLMMVGISVSNSVLMVEFANRQLAGGLTPLEAVVSAARIRLRPILMTTIATIIGLMPMALHLRPGDEMNLPLARAVIGGLTTSTLLTLLVVPVLYTLAKRVGTASDRT